VLPAYTLKNFANPQSFTTHRIERPKLKSQLMLVWSGKRPLTSTHSATQASIQRVVNQSLSDNMM